MTYTLLRGTFVIRYADAPRQGPEPDGDTVKFTPDNPSLVEGLPRPSGQAPDLNSRGISVRLEGIDTLETHFSETHQELLGANGAREELLRLLGFTGVTFFPDLPNKVQSADADRLRGHVLSNGIDANGRMIGFVYPGDPQGPDGAQVWLDEALLDLSANAALITTGHGYPALYDTLPATLRTHIADLSRAARKAGTGLWPRSTADPDGAAHVPDAAALRQLVMWPKLFRRLVPYLAAGHPSFDNLDAWLRADPVHRDDRIFLLDRGEHGNLHDVIHGAGHQIRLTAWPEDFIISPDPAPSGGSTDPSPAPAPGALGDVLIVAALPDPTGADAGRETVTLLNTAATAVGLDGWALTDAAGGRHPLTGTLAPGATHRSTLGRATPLANTGDTIILTDANQQVVDRVTYRHNQARPGRTIAFGRH